MNLSISRIALSLYLAAISAMANAAEPPTFLPSRGYLETPAFVELQSQDGGAIWYTVDGSIPEPGIGLLYTMPIVVDSTQTLRAISESVGEVSTVETHTYIFADDVINADYMEADIVSQYLAEAKPSLLSVPTIALTIPQGIDKVEQRQMSMEFFAADGSEEFQVDAGIRQYGSTSLRDPKPNMRVYFKSVFGPKKLEYPLFNDYAVGEDQGIEPAEVFDQLELRQGSGDSVFRIADRATILRNRLFNDLALTQGVTVPHGRFVQVFINAEYFGVYHLRERFNAAFAEHYHGGSKSDYEAVNSGDAYDGDGTAWPMVKAAAETSFAEFREYVDVNAYIDHMLLAYWSGMRDWTERKNGKIFNKNWQAVGPQVHDLSRRWMFYLHDADNGLDRQPNLYYDMTDDYGPDRTFYNLLQERHPDFMTALADRISVNFFNAGPLTPPRIDAVFQRRIGELELPIVADTARWGRCKPFCRGKLFDPWDRDDEWRSEVNRLLTDFFPQRTSVVMDQFRAAGWFSLEAPIVSESAGELTVVNPPANGNAEIWFSADGSDPRVRGGVVSASAQLLPAGQTVDSAHIIARARLGDQWGPLVVYGGDGFVDAPPGSPLLLNEWNAVDKDKLLDGGDAVDPAFGSVEGNGGDWFELVVTRSGSDLRGYRLVISEESFTQELLTLSDHELWLNLPAGTIITIAEDVPTDTSFDPGNGDWHINIQADNDGGGEFITAANFPASSSSWQLEIRDTTGLTVFGPSGEGRNPKKGVGSDEVGQLRSNPSPILQALTGNYDDGSQSTFGLPNAWSGGSSTQDFSAMRDSTSLDNIAPDWPNAKLELLDVTTDSINIFWSSATDFLGIDSYVVTYQAEGGTVQQVNIEGAEVLYRSVVLTGLPPATYVNVNVEAVDPAGNISTTGPSADFSTAAEALVVSVDGVQVTANVESFSVQDNGSGEAVIVDGASGLAMYGNVWKKIGIDYDLQRTTFLEFDFYGEQEGEVHAIGLETDNKATYSLALQLWGSERFGNQKHRQDYEGRQGETVHYRIPLGKILKPKFYKYLTFISDNDRGSDGAQSVISNITLSTDGATPPPIDDSEPPVLGGDISVIDVLARSAKLDWPSATDNVQIAAYEIVLNGVLIETTSNTEILLSGLDPLSNYDVLITAIDSSGNRSNDSLDVQFTTIAEPPGLVMLVDGEAFTFEIHGFGTQDRDGVASLSADGSTLSLIGNTWYYVDLAPMFAELGLTESDLLESTLSLRFSSSSEGGVHGIALENDLFPSSSRTLKFFGYRNYGVKDLEGYTLDDVPRTLSIPFDTYAARGFRYLVFVNDHDVQNPTGQSTFDNITLTTSVSDL